MPAHQLKDYYKILELPANATQEQVKKSYRALAFKYHPDTSTHNEYAEHYFLEIQEAYNILSDDKRRRQYDEERWLSGMSDRAREQAAITPLWVQREANRLCRHMSTVDTYRMNHSALYDYVMLLLQDNHMAVLKQADDTDINTLVANDLLQSTRHLKHEYMQPLGIRIARLANNNEALLQSIHQQVQNSLRQSLWQRYLPFIIVVITIALCALMYLYSRK